MNSLTLVLLNFPHLQSNHLSIMEALFLVFSDLYVFYFSAFHYCIDNISIKILNRNGNSRYPCLVPNFKLKGFNFSSYKYDVCCRFFIHILYLVG